MKNGMFWNWTILLQSLLPRHSGSWRQASVSKSPGYLSKAMPTYYPTGLFKWPLSNCTDLWYLCRSKTVFIHSEDIQQIHSTVSKDDFFSFSNWSLLDHRPSRTLEISSWEVPRPQEPHVNGHAFYSPKVTQLHSEHLPELNILSGSRRNYFTRLGSKTSFIRCYNITLQN